MINKLTEKFPDIKITGYLCPEFMSAEDLVKNYKEEIKNINTDIFGSLWGSLNKNSS